MSNLNAVERVVLAAVVATLGVTAIRRVTLEPTPPAPSVSTVGPVAGGVWTNRQVLVIYKGSNWTGYTLTNLP